MAYPISILAQNTLVQNHQTTVRIDILNAGSVIASTDPNVSPTIGATLKGSVTRDATASIRGRATFTIVDPTGELAPSMPTDLLSSVSGHEFSVAIGIVTVNGVEWIPQGIFGIAETSTSDSPAGIEITVTGYDRSRKIQRNKFIEAAMIPAVGLAYNAAQRVIPTNTGVGSLVNFIDAIEGLVLDRLPGTTFISTPTEFNVPDVFFDSQADPWAEATKLAESIGYEIFFDILGNCVIRPIPELDSAAMSWFFVEGETATVTDLTTVSSNEAVYNVEVVTGESTTGITPARAVAADVDPTSSTYSGYHSSTQTFDNTPYGANIDFTVDSRILTDIQAGQAAAARLRALKGLSRQVTVNTTTIPQLQEQDVIHITRNASNLDTHFIIQSLTIPFSGVDKMSIITRIRHG